MARAATQTASHTESTEFTGAGGDRLAARIDRPLGPPRGYALFAHCFTCSKDFVASARVSRGLAERGIAVLRFDFTGLGGSAGDFANTHFSSNVDDLVRAADHLRERFGPPSLLVGHSLGGAAVLAAAERIPDATAVAVIGAPADPAHVRGLLGDRTAEIESRGEAEVDLAGRRFRIRRSFLEDLEGQEPESRLRNLKKALLVLHSPIDAVVGIENASRIFLAARHPKSFVSLDRADHLLTRPADAAWVAELISGWASRFLPDAKAPPRPEELAADQGEVVVRESGAGRFGQHVLAGPHRMTADEPPSVGGEDGGPTPYGLLLASLGACTSMTLRMYADRKKLPLERVTVRLRHEKIHAKDCEECETRVGKIDRIERSIRLEGDLDAAQRQRLAEIADRCPVHRTLHGEVRIETELERAEPGGGAS